MACHHFSVVVLTVIVLACRPFDHTPRDLNMIILLWVRVKCGIWNIGAESEYA